MKKSTKIEEVIRVDHAGERGAIKIYEDKLLALKTINPMKVCDLKVTKEIMNDLSQIKME